MGIAQWLERRTHDWKVAGSNPCWSGGRIFFSRVDFLCWLLFRYPFHPRVTAVARKRSRSFCQKCRWQVTAKHAYTLRIWLCLKWHGAWLYGVHRTCAEMAAVSYGTSHASAVSTPLRWIVKNKICYKASHSSRTTCHSSGAVWESRWTSWAVRPNEPSGFRGRKDLLHRASALVTTCPYYVSWHLRTLSINSSSSEPHASAVSLLKRAENSAI